MKLTKSKLQKLIKEELDEIHAGHGGGSGSTERGTEIDLKSAETRASSRESSRDILLDGMREIEEIARDNLSPGEPGYEEILDVIHRTSPDYETDEDDY